MARSYLLRQQKKSRRKNPPSKSWQLVTAPTVPLRNYRARRSEAMAWDCFGSTT